MVSEVAPRTPGYEVDKRIKTTGKRDDGRSMHKTLDIQLTMNADTLSRALRLLHEAGYTPEAFFMLALERTVLEGGIPFKKPRPRRRATPPAQISGLFEQGNLFAPLTVEVGTLDTGLAPRTPEEDEEETGATPTETLPAPTPRVMPQIAQPTLQTITSLQEAQGLIKWREREREQFLTNKAQHASTSGMSVATDNKIENELFAQPNEPLRLLETKQFRVDKQQIALDPKRSQIVKALETLFTIMTHRREPEGAYPLQEGNRAEWVVPVTLTGVTDPNAPRLALIYQRSLHEIVCVRYGTVESLLRSVPADFGKTPAP